MAACILVKLESGRILAADETMEAGTGLMIVAWKY
jgi:hypothetical protein